MVEVIDNNFKVLNIVTREEALRKNLKHKVVLVIIKNGNGEIFVSQRSALKSRFPLKWTVGAGGAVKPGESFKAASKRELKEELGAETSLKHIFDFSYHTNDINYRAKIYFGRYDGPIRLDPVECKQGRWIPAQELRRFIRDGLLCPDTSLFAKKYLGSEKMVSKSKRPLPRKRPRETKNPLFKRLRRPKK